MRIYGIVWGDKSTSQLELWRDMQVVVCLCPQITSGTPLVWHFVEYERQEVSSWVFVPVVLAPRQKGHLWSCFMVHSSGFSWGKIAPGILQLHIFMLFCLLIPPSVLLFWAVLTLLKHSFSLSAMFVYIRVPQNDPINVRVPSLGPRLSLFPEVSYGQQLKRMVLGNIYSWYNDDDLRKKLMRCEIYVVWGWVYELLKLLWGTRTQLTDTFFLACWWLLSFFAFELFGRRPFFLRYSGLSIFRYLDLDFFPPFRKKSRVLACFPGGVKNYSWLLQKLGRIFSL